MLQHSTHDNGSREHARHPADDAVEAADAHVAAVTINEVPKLNGLIKRKTRRPVVMMLYCYVVGRIIVHYFGLSSNEVSREKNIPPFLLFCYVCFILCI